MRKIIFSLLFLTSLISNSFGQSALCSGADPFCTGTTYNFPVSTNTSAETGPDYGCLCAQPNPAWYYLQIATAGDLNINISSTAGDVDFACWGPYSSVTCGAALSASGDPGCTVGAFNQVYGNLVDCSYSIASTEDCYIPNAQVGEIYMVMITNYANVTGDITFSQTGGSGATDCSIVVPFTLTTSQTNVLCNGGNNGVASVSVTGGTAPFSYDWSPNGYTGDGTNTYSNLPAGTYTVTVTDSNGCSDIAALSVDEPAPIDIFLDGPTDFLCIGQYANLSASANGGTSPYTFEIGRASCRERV